MTSNILISACLLGHAVRYDGKGKPLHHPAIERWRDDGRLVTICPEMAGGMPVPRPPAETETARPVWMCWRAGRACWRSPVQM